MSAGEWLAWGAVLLGLVLGAVGVRSTFYFAMRHRELDSWVTLAIYRSVATITGVAIGLTLSRVLQMSFGPLPWAAAFSGVLVVWLLLIPLLLMRGFRQHEGVPIDREETAIEKQDREVGDERRKRQAEDSE